MKKGFRLLVKFLALLFSDSVGVTRAVQEACSTIEYILVRSFLLGLVVYGLLKLMGAL